MPATPKTLREQVYQVGGWSIGMPFLAFWPFLSALPAFSLLGGDLTLTRMIGNVALLGSGFWAFAGAYIVYRIVRGSGQTGDQVAITRERGLWLAAYATVWTIAYGVFAVF